MASNSTVLEQVNCWVPSKVFSMIDTREVKGVVLWGTTENVKQGAEILGGDDVPCTVKAVRLWSEDQERIYAVSGASRVIHPYRVGYLGRVVTKPTVKLYLGDEVKPKATKPKTTAKEGGTES